MEEATKTEEAKPGLLRIEYEPLTDLLERKAARNPKKHDKDLIEGSMGRFGYTAPVTVNERDGRLVAGHGRLETLKDRRERGDAPPKRVDVRDGEWFVPVIRGLSFHSAAEAEAYLLTDNRLVEVGGWDEEERAAVLRSVQEETGSLAGTGYDEDLGGAVASADEAGGSASSFLDGFIDGDGAGGHTPSGVSAPRPGEAREGEGYAEGERYYTLTYAVTQEQRGIVRAAIGKAKRDLGTDNSIEALVGVCGAYGHTPPGVTGADA